MSSRTFFRFVFVLLCVLIVAATVFIAYHLSIREKSADIKVKLDSDTPSQVEFESLSLYPGASVDYTISLSTKERGSYGVLFIFKENRDLTLKNYACVKMECEGEVFYDDLLADAISGGAIMLNHYLELRESVDVKITYYLPENVGNGAQNAEADFYLEISSFLHPTTS